jgi:hypothetical protein
MRGAYAAIPLSKNSAEKIVKVITKCVIIYFTLTIVVPSCFQKAPAAPKIEQCLCVLSLSTLSEKLTLDIFID